jgi:hypothetical protein
MAIMLNLVCRTCTGTWTFVNARGRIAMQSVYVWSHMRVTSCSHPFDASLNQYRSRWPSPSMRPDADCRRKLRQDHPRSDIHHPQATWARVLNLSALVNHLAWYRLAESDVSVGVQRSLLTRQKLHIGLPHPEDNHGNCAVAQAI